MPVFIALAGCVVIYAHFIAGMPDSILHRMAGGIDSFPLLAVPFFILAKPDELGRHHQRIYDFAVAGGLDARRAPHVSIIGSVIFAGMSHARRAGLGTIEIKAMQDHNYTPNTVGVTAASSTLDRSSRRRCRSIYGMMGNVSIGALFLSGVSGMTIFMMAYVLLRAQIRHGARPGLPAGRRSGLTFVAAFPAAHRVIIGGARSAGSRRPGRVAACAWP